jgi:2-polyprenyl-3-methyl-5-hydroxy-6-metoxy-1,4-benzoquinol methylase
MQKPQLEQTQAIENHHVDRQHFPKLTVKEHQRLHHKLPIDSPLAREMRQYIMLTGQAMLKRYYDQLWRNRKRLYLEEKCRKRTILSFVRERTRSSDAAPLRIMDLGCGYGWLTKALSEFGDAAGVDISINEAKKRYPDIKFQEADIMCDEIEGNYDVIVSSEVLEHIAREDHQMFIRRIYELLNGKGYLILTTPNKPVAESLPQNDLQPIENWLNKKSLIRLVEPLFEIKHCGSTYFFPALFFKHTALKLPKVVYGIFYGRLRCYKIIDELLSSTNYGISLVVVGQKRD